MSDDLAGTVRCPFCPDQTPQFMTVTPWQEAVRCPQCRRRLRLLSRRVAKTTTQRLSVDRTRYTMMGVEADGRVRPRVFYAQPNIRLRPGTWVTLVYRGPRLVGIADQGIGFWFPVPALPSRFPRVDRMLQLLSVLCVALAVIQLSRFGPDVTSFVSAHGFAALTSLGACLLVLSAPAVLWALRTLTASAAQPAGYLPTVPGVSRDDVYFEGD